MSNGKETNEYITQEYAYVSDKGIQTQDYFKKLRRAPDTDARQLRDVDLLHDIQFKRLFKDGIENQKHDMHPDCYTHRVQESCANLRRIIDLKCVENDARHDQIYENYGQNLAV